MAALGAAADQLGWLHLLSVVPRLNPLIQDDFVAPPCHDEVEILHCDDSLLVVNKPSGLLTLSGKNPLNKDSVHFRMEQNYSGVLMLHRLDFGTSGILLLARNKHAATAVNRQFQARTIVKTYHAVLAGHLDDDSGVIEAAIAKDPANFPAMKLCEVEGKAAKTEYRVLSRLQRPARTLVQFIPHSGRTHQLRIHSAAIGHPICGCDIYGTDVTQAMASRLQLHASSIALQHPLHGETVCYHCPIPF